MTDARSPRTSVSSSVVEEDGHGEFVTARTNATEEEEGASGSVHTDRLPTDVYYSSEDDERDGAFYSTREDGSGQPSAITMPFVASPHGVAPGGPRRSAAARPSLPSAAAPVAAAAPYSITFDPVNASRQARAGGAVGEGDPTSGEYAAGYPEGGGWDAEGAAVAAQVYGYDYAEYGYDGAGVDYGAYDGYGASYDPTAATYTEEGGGEGGGPPRYGMGAEDVRDIFSLTRHNRAKDVLELLDRGVNPNVADPHGNTVLAIACQNGLRRIAKGALRKGADINYRNHRGNTPLHFCFQFGYGDSLGQYLISKGADPTIRNSDGFTCFDDPASLVHGYAR